MKLIKDQFLDLLHFSQLFLLREHTLDQTLLVSPTVIDFFNKKSPPSATPPVQKRVEQSPLILQKSHSFTQQQSEQAPPRHHIKEPTHTLTIQTPKLGDAKSVEEAVKPIPAKEPSKESGPKELQVPLLQTEVKQSATNEKGEKKKGFNLEPLGPLSQVDTSDGWKLYPSLFPDWRLSHSIPFDKVALKNKNAWLKTQEVCPIIILCFNDSDQQLTFLKNIARAISLRLAPTKLISAPRIEKENGWDSLINSKELKLVIAGDYALYLHPKLMQLHREVPQLGKHFLKDTPLLLLSDLSLYLKEPQLKPLLWRAICNEFAAAQSHPISQHSSLHR